MRLLTALFLALSLALSPLLAGFPAAAAGPDWTKVDPALQALMQQNPQGEWPVLVEAAAAPADADAQLNDRRARKAGDLLDATGGKRQAPLPILGAANGSADYEAIAALSRHPDVAYVYYDAPVTVAAETEFTHVYDDAVRAPTAWNLGYTGKGVAVAVLDSGVRQAPDLSQPTNRIVARVDMVADGATMLDPGGHGTHVAGIIAGNGAASAGAVRGIAPEANIVDVRVVDAQGRSRLSTVIRGVQWVVQNRHAYNVRVLNLSLSAPVGPGYTYRRDPLVAALEIAWLSGITVVVPAGNGGPSAGTIASPGTSPMLITVGATDDGGTAATSDDVVASFSGRGPTPDRIAKPDLVAPGRRIVSLRSPGSYLDTLLPERVVSVDGQSEYFRLTGTSMATPVVAGVAALLLQKDPSLTPDQVKHILTSSAARLPGYPANSKNLAGAGLVDAAAALASTAKDKADGHKRPADATARALLHLVKGKPLGWWDKKYAGRLWENVNWDNVLWDGTTWDNVLWDRLLGDNVLWDNVLWDNVLWDNVLWDNVLWDNVLWDNVLWDNVLWDNVLWDNALWDVTWPAVLD